MTSKGASDQNFATLLLKLCSKLTGYGDDAVTQHYQYALRIIASNFSTPGESDEFEVADKIKRKLVRKNRQRDAALFSELHRKLQAQDILKNRWAILYLLMSLSDTETKSQTNFSALFGNVLLPHATSTPNTWSQKTPADTHSRSYQSVTQSVGSSGISSIRSDIRSSRPSPVPQSFIPSMMNTPAIVTDGRPLGPRLAWQRTDDPTESALILRKDQATSQSLRRHRRDEAEDIPESELLKDVIYVFQGIEGKWVKYDASKDGYRIDAQVELPKATRQIICKLAECGWLYNKTKNYIDNRSSDKAFGLVGQSFCAALQQELTEYYRLVAVLESQFQLEQDQGISLSYGGLTLRRLVVWTFDPLLRLKTLAALVDASKGKKGGALTSAIYSYMQHGDPYMQSLINQILTMVAQPIYAVLIRWIYDGELEDTYHEFFVASNPTVKNDRLWQDKYSLRKSVIPSFILIEQARKILLTGKSINFLRQVCLDRTPIKGRELSKRMDMNQANCMLTQDTTNEFQHKLDAVYKDTSQHLLEVLHTQYKFTDHLKAMRRYLLLGQGDFIRHLMDLLKEDLAKPAGNLYLHNLTGILETTIRATNAQFDDSDILKRLDVRLLEVSPGDTGWDVFSLDYHVDGPIRTVFTPECMIIYLRVFNFLWRAKRMEYILSIIWKNQTSNARLLKSLPELASILHQCYVLGCEMFHFIQQVQYYINFEVLECSWDELVKKVQEAKDLDYIIAAHQVFLDTIISRCLLDEKSIEILTQLRTIFDLIIQFQSAQDAFYEAATDEIRARQHFDEMQKKKTAKGEWALTEADEEEEKTRRSEFLKQIIPSTRPQLTVLAQSYQGMVQQFLLMLTSHQDVSLRFLSFRLDFNEHYKAREPKLKSPLVYQRVKRRTHDAAK